MNLPDLSDHQRLVASLGELKKRLLGKAGVVLFSGEAPPRRRGKPPISQRTWIATSHEGVFASSHATPDPLPVNPPEEMHFRLVIAVLGLSFLLGLLILAALVIRDSQPTWSYFSGSMQEYFSVDLGSWGETPSATPTSTQTATATATATSTPTPTETATPTPTRRPRKTRRPTETLTQTPTITDTATQTPTPTDTPTATVTPTPSITPPPNCTYSIGYWKEHPESWPLVEISLGEREYTAEQALALLSEPPQEDASLHLVRQLIAARLNIASGADYISMNEIILQSDTWLERYPPGSNPGEPDRQEGLNLATLLDEFNTGVTGPGLCPVVLSFSLPLFNIHNG